MSVPKVTAIVVSYNARDVLRRCLGALDATRHEVIVVDNASEDGSPELVRQEFPDAALIEAGANLGFGAANNLAMRQARGAYFALINSDAWAIGDGLDSLVRFAASDPSAGIVGPRLVGEDGTVQKSVRSFPTVWRICTEYFFLRKLAPSSRALNAFYGAGFDYGSVRESDWLMGAALVVRRELIDEIGGFDERFFLFSEEVDLCFRANQAGWKTVYTPSATFVHLGGASTGPRWSRMYREQLRGHVLFLEKHSGAETAERARRWLVRALRLRARVFPGERGRTYAEAASWLGSRSVGALLESSA
ncbi:MAG: glycosyltransferase family 2 protein [Gaiellaceae bacterium]